MSILSTPSSPSLPSHPLPSAPFTLSPKPSTSNPNTNDPMLNHLLNLPPVLQSISPSLAALHMARIRLSLSLPTSPRYYGRLLNEWCNLCGGLRSRLGGVDPTSNSSSAIEPSNKAKPEPKNGYEALKEKRRLHQLHQRRSRMRNPICSTCGEKYKKPQPDPATLREYPPARRTRRMVRSIQEKDKGDSGKSVRDEKKLQQIVGNSNSGVNGASEAEDMKMDVNNSDIIGNPTSQVDSDPTESNSTQVDRQNSQVGNISKVINHDNKSTADNKSNPDDESTMINDQLPNPGVASTPTSNPPKLLSRPSLSHIPNSSPNLPTYPQPPPSKPTSSTSGAGKKSMAANGKRKKKSGLAKLLAENKEREVVNQGNVGMWGL